MIFSKERSIASTTTANIKEATMTVIAKLCSSFTGVQETL